MVYLDDIVVFSKTIQEHVDRIQIILNCLLKAAKAVLHALGHVVVICAGIVSCEGICPIPYKMKALTRISFTE